MNHQEQEPSLLRLLEVMSIKDTLAFMDLQKQVHDQIIPRCICTTDMRDYECDEAALFRLQAKLLKEEDMADEGES